MNYNMHVCDRLGDGLYLIYSARAGKVIENWNMTNCHATQERRSSCN